MIWWKGGGGSVGALVGGYSSSTCVLLVIYMSNFSEKMHDHTSKGLKQLAVMKISNIILRYCMTNHYYMYFIKSHIFLLNHENSTPPPPAPHLARDADPRTPLPQ